MDMKEIEKPLKFIIIGHKDFDEYVPFYVEIFKNNIQDVIFIFDNEINSSIKKILNDNKILFFVNEKNIGKLNSLIKWSDKFNSKYIKVLDSDDSFDERKINILNKKISNYDGESLIVHRGTALEKKDKYYGIQSSNLKIIKKQIKLGSNNYWELPPNAKSIYPTKSLQKLKEIEIIRQDFFNDDLLALSTLIIFNNKIDFVDCSFYIQFRALGQTSEISVKRLNNFNILMENLIKVKNKFNENIKFIGSRTPEVKQKLFNMWVERFLVENKNFEIRSLNLIKQKFNNLNTELFSNFKEIDVVKMTNKNNVDLTNNSIKSFLLNIENGNKIFYFDNSFNISKIKKLKELSFKIPNLKFFYLKENLLFSLNERFSINQNIGNIINVIDWKDIKEYQPNFFIEEKINTSDISFMKKSNFIKWINLKK